MYLWHLFLAFNAADILNGAEDSVNVILRFITKRYRTERESCDSQNTEISQNEECVNIYCGVQKKFPYFITKMSLIVPNLVTYIISWRTLFRNVVIATQTIRRFVTSRLGTGKAIAIFLQCILTCRCCPGWAWPPARWCPPGRVDSGRPRRRRPPPGTPGVSAGCCPAYWPAHSPTPGRGRGSGPPAAAPYCWKCGDGSGRPPATVFLFSQGKVTVCV
jgi:hypothetical protein